MFTRNLLVAAALAFGAQTASADFITFEFTANGVIDNGEPQTATALFTFDTDNPDWLKITLTDTASGKHKSFNFEGALNGTLSATESSLDVSFLSPRTMSLPVGNYVYSVEPGGPLPEPSQLPEVFNKLQDFRLDVRHRITNRLAATFAYRYEPFSVYDFAFDPSVVDGIVQPSSLVLGYVYRPYTAHSFVAGVRYLF